MKKLLVTLLGLAMSALLSFLLLSVWASHHYDVSARFLLERLTQRIGIQHPLVISLLQPPPRYSALPLDGQIRDQHPRVLLPGLAQWDGEGVAPVMARRLALYTSRGAKLGGYLPCGRKHAMSHVMCWLTTGKTEEARQAIRMLVSSHPEMPSAKETDGGDSWEWALAFDLLNKFSGLTKLEREAIAARMRDSLLAHLQLLDDDSVSLWHGRSSLAAQAWLLAVALHGEPGHEANLTRRAQGHFQQTIRALALTEAWPEGYNYWINSRALVIALAGAAWVNGLENSQFSPLVTRALHRVGMWTIYTTRPDHRIESQGDEGPRVDLKDETRRVIDVITQVTGEGVFASYSAYLERLHRHQSYYRGFRWSFVLFNDPSISILAGVEEGQLAGLESYLPLGELFGEGALNLFVARTGWDEDDTLVTLRAGHTFTHHGHYDAGHFTVFKGAPLAIDSSRYNGFLSQHRLYYGIRTVAKNSLLVVRRGDEFRPHPLIDRSVNEGGQRLVMPTGSRVRDVDHWVSNLGAKGHFEGGELSEYQLDPDRFAYLKTDLTAAYDSTRFDSQGSGGKVALVERELLYLFAEDRLLVRDKVIGTDGAYQKKWLLHTVTKPMVGSSKILIGNESAGVMESKSDTVAIENGPGRLDLKRILPEAATVRLVGGAGYEYWIENDSGPDSLFDGKNFNEGAESKPWFDGGSWRLEILPPHPRVIDEFLIALSPSLGVDRSREVNSVEVAGGHATVITTGEYVVVYTGGNRLDQLSFLVTGEQRALLIVGVVAGDEFTLMRDNRSLHYNVTRSGVYSLGLPSMPPGSRIVLKQD